MSSETVALQPAQAPTGASVVEKKLDTRDFHAVHTAGLAIFSDLLERTSSHSFRFFGTSSSYAKNMGLPEDAPKKKFFTNMKKLVRELQKEFTRKYNAVTTTDRRDADGKPIPRRQGMSRIVLCSAPLTTFMKLKDWNLMSTTHPGRAYATHGRVTVVLADYIKLMMLQNPNDPQYWSADEAIMTLFGEEQFKRKNVDPKAIRFIDIQKLLSGDKDNKEKVPGHLLSIRKDTLEPDLEADIRMKCLDSSESEFGGAVHRVHNLRAELKTISDEYIKMIKSRDAAREFRPGQKITALWEASVVEQEAKYAKKGAEIRKAAESYNFPIAAAFPPKLTVPVPRPKKAKVAAVKNGAPTASNPATRAAGGKK
jgi:Fe-S-cluster formation regulator IscX/YfhJ